MPKIRKLQADDYLPLKEFLSSLSPKTIRLFSFNPLPENYAESFLNRDDITCFVADLQGKIVGFVWWEPNSSNFPTLAICVQDEYQRNGLGKRLLSKLIGEAKLMGKKGLRLTVSQDNEVAINLYLKSGFQIVGEYKDIRGKNYVMELILNQHIDISEKG